jgi:hypothetical protein
LGQDDASASQPADSTNSQRQGRTYNQPAQGE